MTRSSAGRDPCRRATHLIVGPGFEHDTAEVFDPAPRRLFKLRDASPYASGEVEGLMALVRQVRDANLGTEVRLMSSSSGHPRWRLGDPLGQARYDITRAWAAVAAMVAYMAVMSWVMNALEWDPSFSVGMLVFGAAVLVLAGFGATAVHFGRRARQHGKDAGILPAAVGGTIAGMFVLLAIAVLVAHVAGFE
jgi:hypothetical protein